MTLKQKVKLECFCAFIHSRLIGLGTDDNPETDISILKTKEDVNNLMDLGMPIINYIGSVATLESINKRITDGNSSLIANMYHDNYSKLLKLMEIKVKNGDEVINSVIGIGLLIAYIENDKHEKTLNLDMDTLIKITDFYITKSDEHKKIVTKMMQVSTFIAEKYWGVIKIRKEKKIENNTIKFSNTLDIDLMAYVNILKHKGYLESRDVFILNSRLNDISFEDIAEKYSIKKERVANIERSLLAKLKHPKCLKEFING